MESDRKETVFRGDMSHNTPELVHYHNKLVEFLDQVMLPDARLACSGNRAASTRLKRNMVNFRRMIRDLKSRCSDFPGPTSLNNESFPLPPSLRSSDDAGKNLGSITRDISQEEPPRKRHRPTPTDADFISIISDSDSEEGDSSLKVTEKPRE